jgi:transposase
MKSPGINKYSRELRDKVLQEVKETGNIALVARAHDLRYQTVFSWVQRARREPIRKKAKALKEQDLKLQRLELENRVLKELLKKTNQAWLGDDPSLKPL